MTVERPAWIPTEALRRAVVVILVLLVVAVVAGRVDLVVIAAPFALGTVWALRQRPRSSPEVSVACDEVGIIEGAELSADITVADPDPAPYDAAVVRFGHAPWFRFEESTQALAAGVGAEQATTLTVEGEALRWGWHRFGPAEVYAVACDAMLCSEVTHSDSLPLRVLPRTDHFDASDAMPRAAGLVGVHRSRRYGDGGELSGIRQFVPGDRLRRIDWRTSLRAGELHVAQTLSDRDAEVVVLLDVLHEAGISGGADGDASVLDTTVRASAGIAEHYLGCGDRVMVVEFGGRGRALRPGSGRRHYLATLEWLLSVRAGEGAVDPSARLFGNYRIPSSALVVVLTPLLEDRSVAMLARMVRSGRSVVAVDTLPADIRPPGEGRWSDVAYRLWRLERRNTIDELLEHGVPTVQWAGAGSLDHVLRDVARMAAFPR